MTPKRGDGSEHKDDSGAHETPGKRDAKPSYRPNIRDAPLQGQSRSLEYGLAMLECFSRESPVVGIAELADMLRISRSTAHRYAISLVALGKLEQDNKRRYRLAGSAAYVGMSALGVIAKRTRAWSMLTELRALTGHTASLAVLTGPQATYVQRAHSHGCGQYAADGDVGAGAHVPLHCTALGKAMLAIQPEKRQRELLAEVLFVREGPNTITAKHDFLQHLARIKAAGIALNDEEDAAGIRSIAVAVGGHASRQTLGLEVTVPASAYTLPALAREIGPHVRAAAQSLPMHIRGTDG